MFFSRKSSFSPSCKLFMLSRLRKLLGERRQAHGFAAAFPAVADARGVAAGGRVAQQAALCLQVRVEGLLVLKQRVLIIYQRLDAVPQLSTESDIIAPSRGRWTRGRWQG